MGLTNLINNSSFKTKLIHFSTDYIFDGKSGPYDESSIPNPINYYGKTKLESENILIGSIFSDNLFDISAKDSGIGKDFLTFIL